MAQKLLHRLKLMGIFCHVVESGSMRSAAKKLGLSPPAISQFISQLEQELNVTLLYRSTRRISTSEAGEKYYHASKKMLTMAEQADDVIQQTRSDISGELRIAIPVGLATKPIATALKPMLEDNPSLRLSITANDEYIDFIKERIDIAVDCGQASDSSYIYHHLGKNNKHIYASPDYLEKHGSPVTPQALTEHAWLGLREAGQKGVLCNVELHHQRHDSFCFKPHLRFEFNDLNSMISHILEGFGIAILPTLEVSHWIESGELVPLLPNWYCEKHDIFALTRSRSYPLKVKAALGAMKNYFSQIETTDSR